MAFHAPAPGVVGGGIPKNAEEIEFRIANDGGAGADFHVMEDLFEAHDCGGFDVAAVAKAGAEKRLSEVTLGGVHFFEGEAAPFSRNEMPVKPLLIFEIERGFGFLFGLERVEEVLSGFGHFLGGTVSLCGLNAEWRQRERK